MTNRCAVLTVDLDCPKCRGRGFVVGHFVPSGYEAMAATVRICECLRAEPGVAPTLLRLWLEPPKGK